MTTTAEQPSLMHSLAVVAFGAATGRRAIITDVDHLGAGLAGKAGTTAAG